jgi:hypothetical protein
MRLLYRLIRAEIGRGFLNVQLIQGVDATPDIITSIVAGDAG